MSAVALYRHFDADGQLLYVGISANPFERGKQHKGDSDWFQQVSTITLEWFAKRSEAEVAEIEAIRCERPSFNKKHKRCGDENTVEGIIDLWPRQEDLAADCGVERVAVSRWKERSRIPAKHFPAMLSSASRRGISLTAEQIVRAAETFCEQSVNEAEG